MTIRNVSQLQIIQKTITGLSAILVLLLSSGTAYADAFDDQINAARQAANAAQAQANEFHAQANDAQTKINQLNAQINALQTQINLSEAESRQLTQQIADAQAKLTQQKAVLGDIVKTMYFDSSVSPLEMLASSSNIGDFLDQEQYRESIKGKIQSAMDEIQKLTKTLQAKQEALEKTLADQKGQKQALTVTQSEAAQLLALASQNAAAADAQVRDSNSQIATLKAQQAAAIAAASRRVGAPPGASGGAGGACDRGSGNGGYPTVWCNAGQDTMIDSWGMYNRECVSYAAWASTVRFGRRVPYWGGHGNANQWPGNARADGIAVDGSPRVGDVAIWMGGTYGHAMIVEQIKGGTVVVSSMNADNNGHFQYDEWSTGALVYIHF